MLKNLIGKTVCMKWTKTRQISILFLCNEQTLGLGLGLELGFLLSFVCKHQGVRHLPNNLGVNNNNHLY